MSVSVSKIDWECTSEYQFGTEKEIHIWLIPIIENQHIDNLSPDEISKANSYPHNQVKDIYISSRIAMRDLFCHYLQCSSKDIKYSISKNGKPFLEMPENQLKFNLSHSKNIILLAVSNHCEVGIDVENKRITKNWQKIADKVFDKDLLNTLKKAEFPEEIFIKLWTEFEANQKLFGQGIFGNKKNRPLNNKSLHFQPQHDYQATLAFNSNLANEKIKFYKYCG